MDNYIIVKLTRRGHPTYALTYSASMEPIVNSAINLLNRYTFPNGYVYYTSVKQLEDAVANIVYNMMSPTGKIGKVNGFDIIEALLYEYFRELDTLLPTLATIIRNGGADPIVLKPQISPTIASNIGVQEYEINLDSVIASVRYEKLYGKKEEEENKLEQQRILTRPYIPRDELVAFSDGIVANGIYIPSTEDQEFAPIDILRMIALLPERFNKSTALQMELQDFFSKYGIMSMTYFIYYYIYQDGIHYSLRQYNAGVRKYTSPAQFINYYRGIGVKVFGDGMAEGNCVVCNDPSLLLDIYPGKEDVIIYNPYTSVTIVHFPKSLGYHREYETKELKEYIRISTLQFLLSSWSSPA